MAVARLDPTAERWPLTDQAQRLPGAKGTDLSETTTTFTTQAQSRTSRSLHNAALSAQMEPPIVLGSALVPWSAAQPREVM